MRTGFVSPQLSADARGSHRAVAPAFNPQGEPKGRVSLAVFDFAEPADRLRRQVKLSGALGKCQTSGAAVFDKKHAAGSLTVNPSSSRAVLFQGEYISAELSHSVRMSPIEHHNWYLREWFAVIGLKQHDLVTKLDYPKNSAFKLWHGVQPYRRDNVEEIAALLSIRPYELLMPPEEAMQLRRLRSVIAEVAKPESEAALIPANRTGTSG